MSVLPPSNRSSFSSASAALPSDSSHSHTRRASYGVLTTPAPPQSAPAPVVERENPKCSRCSQTLLNSKIVVAAGKKCHVNCFLCNGCNMSLVGSKFKLDPSGQTEYCLDCYADRFAPSCAACRMPISGDYYNVEGSDYHKDCLHCSVCSDALVNAAIYLSAKGKVLCRGCSDKDSRARGSLSSSSPIHCAVCGLPTTSTNSVRVLDSMLHSSCLRCSVCFRSIDLVRGEKFRVKGDHIFCESDFEQKFKCFACQKPLDGEYLTVESLNRLYHVQCLKADCCGISLADKRFFPSDEGDVIMCEEHFSSDGLKCAKCSRYIEDAAVYQDGVQYHKECFESRGAKGRSSISEVKYHNAQGAVIGHRLSIHAGQAQPQSPNPASPSGPRDSTFRKPDLVQSPNSRSSTFRPPIVQRSSLFVTQPQPQAQPHPADEDAKSDAKHEDELSAALASLSPSASSAAPPPPSRSPPAAPISTRGRAMSEDSDDDGEDDDGSDSDGSGSVQAGSPRAQRRTSAIYDAPLVNAEGKLIDPKDTTAGPSEKQKAKAAKLAAHTFIPFIKLGMSACLGTEDSSLFRLGRSLDYRKKILFKLKFDDTSFAFQDYAPRVFAANREKFGISLASFTDSLVTQGINGGNLGLGKSGQLFYFSNDRRYVMKTVSRAELKFFRSILKNYHEHISNFPHTLLPRFFGLYKIMLPDKPRVRFVVMNNAFYVPPTVALTEKYDLKGSTRNRIILDPQPGMVLLDQNFKTKIRLGAVQKRAFELQLTKDVAWLQKNNIMDYSLLVGIDNAGKGIASARSGPIEPPQLNSPLIGHPFDPNFGRSSIFQASLGGIRGFESGSDGSSKPSNTLYFISIIDILQEFSLRKRVESSYKMIRFNKNAISAIESRAYGDRFMQFLLGNIE